MTLDEKALAAGSVIAAVFIFLWLWLSPGVFFRLVDLGVRDGNTGVKTPRPGAV